MSDLASPHKNAMPLTLKRMVRGTPGTWPVTWAGQIHPWLLQAGIDAPLADAASPVPGGHTARQVFVVESPITGLAAALEQDAMIDAAAWLDAWQQAAQRLLKGPVHPRPLWLEWREVHAAPDALPALLGADPAAVPGGNSVELLPEIDPVCLLIARALVESHTGIRSLMPTLLARCTPLGQATDTSGGDELLQDRAGHIDPAAVARRWITLEQHAASAPALQRALSAAEAERDARAAEVGERERDAADAREEAELLLLQLHQVQEELETQFLQRREAEELLGNLQAEAAALRHERDQLATEATHSRHHAEHLAAETHAIRKELETQFLQRREAEELLGNLREEAAALRQERDHLATEVAHSRQHAEQVAAEARALRHERDTLVNEAAALHDALLQQRAAVTQHTEARQEAEHQATTRQAELQSELEAHRASAKAASEEAELLLLQLHQVQEELEEQFLARRELANTLAAQPAHTYTDSLFQASAAALAVAYDRDTPPHRELTFRFRGVKVEDRHVAEATVRLVEHCGHPGLVIFKSTDDSPLLQGWQETGREDDRPYLLLVPDDPSHEARLSALTSQDEALLPVLVHWIEQHLRSHDPDLSERWAHVARRLRALLAERPATLKFESATAQLLARVDENSEPQHGWSITLKDVRHGARAVPSVRVHWRPEDPMRPWALLGDARAGPPLPAWTGGAGGGDGASERMEFVFGTSAHADLRHTPWTRMPPTDRQFVLALLQRWPDVVRQALGGRVDTEALALAADTLLQEALQALHPHDEKPSLRTQALIGRMVRRLRHANAPNHQAPAISTRP